MMTKENLLATGMFIDNKYLNSYLAIVANPCSNVRYTEKHHILPKSYFKLTKKKIDHSKDNIVKLSYYEHILAHYYLSLCTTGKLRFTNIGAFIMLTETTKAILSGAEQDALIELEHIAELKELARADRVALCKKLGTKKKTSVHKAALCKARDLHSTTKGRKSMYSSALDKVCYIPPEAVDKYITDGWRPGGKPLSAAAKLKIGKSNSIALLGKRHKLRADNKTNSGLISNKVVCVELNKVFDSTADAKTWLYNTKGIDGGQIKNCCSGSRTTTGGYHWKYLDKREIN